MSRRPLSPGHLLVFAGAAAVVLGCFLPAAEPRGTVIFVRSNTFVQNGDAKYLLVAAALAAWLGYRRWTGTSSSYLPIVVVGALIVLAVLAAGSNTRIEYLNGREVPADPGVGVSVVALGGIAIVAGGIGLRRGRPPQAGATTPSASEGWYPNPNGADELRWWDGQKWTGATKPADTAHQSRPH